MDDKFFTGYRQTCLAPEEAMVSLFLPFTKETEFVEAFKQAKRREDDIAIVNACLRVVLDSTKTKIENAFLSFGGVNKTTVCAVGTEAALKGQTWDSKILETATNALVKDIQLPAGC